jgi:diguanylate cyclase (GGDEF)-like protein
VRGFNTYNRNPSDAALVSSLQMPDCPPRKDHALSPWKAARLPPSLHVAAFRALHGVTSRIHHSLDLTTTLGAITQGVVDAAGFEVAAMNFVRADGRTEVVSVVGDEDARRSLMNTVQTEEFWTRMTAASRPLGRLRFIDGSKKPTVTEMDSGIWTSNRKHSSSPDAWHPMDFLFAPLHGSTGRWLGMLAVDLPVHGLRPGPEQCEILELFADHAALAIEHAQLHDDIRKREAEARYAARHDPLTGLWNHARLKEELTEGPTQEPTAVVVVDLDNFKGVNDQFGHLVGDRVLQSAAHRILDAASTDDIVIRTGGDEFVIVLRGPDVDSRMRKLASAVAEGMNRPIDIDGLLCTVSASIGTAYSRGGGRLEALLVESDADMYRRKNS